MNKIMEYMALGKPIVQFETIEGKASAEDASLYARANDFEDFAQKIVELLDDESRRNSMSAIGKQRIQKKLEWKYEVPRLLSAYGQLFSDLKK